MNRTPTLIQRRSRVCPTVFILYLITDQPVVFVLTGKLDNRVTPG
ncbi:MAG: hypothetical protein WBF68_00380 [Atribacterota bacterium]